MYVTVLEVAVTEMVQCIFKLIVIRCVFELFYQCI